MELFRCHYLFICASEPIGAATPIALRKVMKKEADREKKAKKRKKQWEKDDDVSISAHIMSINRVNTFGSMAGTHTAYRQVFGRRGISIGAGYNYPKINECTISIRWLYSITTFLCPSCIPSFSVGCILTCFVEWPIRTECNRNRNATDNRPMNHEQSHFPFFVPAIFCLLGIVWAEGCMLISWYWRELEWQPRNR